MRVITPATWTSQPWRNGRGITHEIVRWPDGDGAEYDVRVSLATVTEDGPFSTFPGQRRWTFVADEGGVELSADQARAGRTYVPVFPAARLATVGAHLELAGELPIVARLLGGPTHLLNVLARVPVVCGAGPTTRPVTAVVALAETPALPRWHARILETPTVIDTRECVWLAWPA